jgi:hypothetical protein
VSLLPLPYSPKERGAIIVSIPQCWWSALVNFLGLIWYNRVTSVTVMDSDFQPMLKSDQVCYLFGQELVAKRRWIQ